MDYTIERENNIIKNIAREIIVECTQNGVEATHEMADYLVKLKMLNPNYGFTASEVMPRSLTQQLVLLVVDDLKQNTPAMNCIRMQVFWSTINLNITELKKEYTNAQIEKAEPYLTEILTSDNDDYSKMLRNIALYTLVLQNLENPNHTNALRETLAAMHSLIRSKYLSNFCSSNEKQKLEKLKLITKLITGVRLLLKHLGKAGDGIEDLRTMLSKIELLKEEVSRIMDSITTRIEDIQEAITAVVAIEYFFKETADTADVFLPPEFEMSDLKHLKQIHVIMLQHNAYMSDLSSKLDEIDGDVHFYVKKLDSILQRLQNTVEDRDAVPTTEVFDDFTQAGELWSEILSYSLSLNIVIEAIKRLDEINKKEYFYLTPLEKAVATPKKSEGTKTKENSTESSKANLPSAVMLMSDSEDFHVEFRGYCAWTLFFGDGYIIPGSPTSGYFNYNDQYYSFATKVGLEFWSKDPYYYIMRIYELLRSNPEMIGLLNAYDALYSTKTLQLEQKTERKVSNRSMTVQTVTHPIERFWDKDYTYSEWELKKRALALSRLIKCVTKSVQTTNRSHFRASIGITVAPDKNKEVQTKKDNYCVHPTISTYLYGLRGHTENKFKVLTLTRPLEEDCERIIVLQKRDLCKDRNQKQSKRTAHGKNMCNTGPLANTIRNNVVLGKQCNMGE